MAERYPKALLLVSTQTWFTIKEMSTYCGVNARQIYRWIDREYIERRVMEGQVHVKVVPNPNRKNEKLAVKRKFTDEQLEEFYQQIVEGKRDVKIDIGIEVRKGSPQDTFEQILRALDDYRELVAYIITR